MSKHQIIYTSTRMGLYDVNDGLHIYSHDRGLGANSKEEATAIIKPYVAVGKPVLRQELVGFLFEELGEKWKETLFPRDELNEYLYTDKNAICPDTDEITARFPSSFRYEKNDDGKYVFSLFSFPGRDYKGGTSRLGNVMCHTIFSDEAFASYPCEYYGNSILLKRLDDIRGKEEQQPDYLPAPDLQKGNLISRQSVVDFLTKEDRMEMFIYMINSMIQYDNDKKRLLICDRIENVIYWIAALEYVFPERNIRELSFDTYVYNPDKYTARICGVLPYGTDYSYERFEENYYIFDFVKNKYTNISTEHRFFKFISMMTTISIDSLLDFHEFLTNGYSYDKVDSDILSGYSLYEFIKTGIKNMNEESVKEAIVFSSKYGNAENKKALYNKILRDPGFATCSSNLFLSLIKYISNNGGHINNQQLDVLKCNMIERIFNAFNDPQVNGKAFESTYKTLEKCGNDLGFSVFDEIIGEDYLKRLLADIIRCSNFEKISCFVAIIIKQFNQSSFVINDSFLNTKYFKIFRKTIVASYNISNENGLKTVDDVLRGITDTHKELIYLSLIIERIIKKDLSDNEYQISQLWSVVVNVILDEYSSDIKGINQLLLNYKKYDVVFNVYSLSIQNAKDLEKMSELFEVNYNTAVSVNSTYSKFYEEKVMNLYYQKINSYNLSESERYLDLLLQHLMRNKLCASFAEELVHTIVNNMPLNKKSNYQSILHIYEYTTKILRKTVDQKTMLLYTAFELEKISSKKDWNMFYQESKDILQLRAYDLKASNDYIDWVSFSALEICKNGVALGDILSIFALSLEQEKKFIVKVTDAFVKLAKKVDSNIPMLADYLIKLIAFYNSPEIIKEIAQSLSSLNKAKYQLLDENIEKFNPDTSINTTWTTIKTAVEQGNPVLSFVRGLVKKIRK